MKKFQKNLPKILFIETCMKSILLPFYDLILWYDIGPCLNYAYNQRREKKSVWGSCDMGPLCTQMGVNPLQTKL